MFTFALGCLGFVGEASAKKWTGFDRFTGVSFVVDGRSLTTTITPGPHAAATRAELQGRNVRGACTSTYGDFKNVRSTRLWPVDAETATFTFDRDISGRLAGSGCLLERAAGGRDIADVAFGPAPARLFATSDYLGAWPQEAMRRYLRIRDARGRNIKTVRGPYLLTTLLRPGRYTLIRFERGCRGTCRKLGPPRLRCARRFRLKPGAALFSIIFIRQETRHCRIVFHRDTQ